MLLNPYRFGLPPAGPIIVDGAKFNGTTTHMARGGVLTGVVPSRVGIFSVWFQMDGSSAHNNFLNGTTVVGGGGTTRFNFRRNLSNRMTYTVLNTTGGALNSYSTASTPLYTASPVWHHMLASWDVSPVNPDPSIATFYIDDVDSISAPPAPTSVTADIGYNSPEVMAGADHLGTTKFNGSMAELYFNTVAYMDFTVVANRRKFISSLLKPMDLGADGSLPTGSPPIVYFHLADGEAPANFAINRGTGGNFSITGALTTASTSPSD